MPIRIHPQVVKLFLGLVQPPKNCQMYSNCLDTWSQGGLAVVDDHQLLLTGITTKKSIQAEAEEVYEDRMRILRTDNPHFYDPLDQFHLGFAGFQFGEQQEFLPVQDKLMIWKCSEHDANREAPMHLLGMEGMLSAMLVGGYFGVVLPKKWLGRQMTYMRWWQDHCATVARIKLPVGAVKWYDDRFEGLTPIRFPMPKIIDPEKKDELIAHESLEPEWQLFVFHRPAVYSKRTPRSEPLARIMPFAEFRFTPFIFPLETLQNDSIDECTKKFFRHDWWRNSVSLWRTMLEEHHNHSILGTYRTKAFGLNEQQDFWIFNPSEKAQHVIHRVPKAADLYEISKSGKRIPKDIRGVQIKFGSSVRIQPTSQYAIGALLDLKSQMGMEKNEDGDMEFSFDRMLYRKSFSEVRDEVIERIYEVGLVPYMTENDHHRMERQERWLSIQLTPSERMVHVGARTEEEQLDNPNNWEWMYEDIGIQATFPELYHMWAKRARQMNIHRFVNDFQFRDVVYLAIRQSQVLGDVPGLGKTRQALFASILRCARKVLIICPGKLIGTWQDEIRDTIVPFARMQKRDWQGNVIDPTVNVIEWGRDLTESHLARFNIIGIDKLKETPRDGRFYRCPVCGTVAYCKDAGKLMTCPGDANLDEDDPKRCSYLLKAWQEENRPIKGERPGRRKYRQITNDLGEVILKVNGTKYPLDKAWFKKFGEPLPKNFPLETVQVIDERRPKPAIPLMEQQESMYSKMIRLQTGMIDDPNRPGEQKPVYKMVKRPFHVKWTFAEQVRWMFPFVIADELHYIANEESKRNQAVEHVTGATRIGLTGTPMKGYPEKILPLLNWVFDRAVFPDYRDYDPEGMERFKKKYELVVHVDATELADGRMAGGQKKRLPKINNAELFQNEMSPLILRRIRNEPEVVACIPPYRIVRERVEVPMDEEHKTYYRKWLQVFAEWWAEMKREKEGQNVEKGNILTKLTYLANASFIPHFMLDSILGGKDEEGAAWARMIGKYKGPPVAKMKHAWKLIREAKHLGEKSLVFSYRQRNSDLGHHWSTKNGINSMVVDGRDSIKVKTGMDRSERHLKVQRFRSNAYDVMWAGTGALAEGMNIPEANHGIVMDATWDDVSIRQAIGRMLRIQQQRTVYAHYLMHHGAIDSYMFALSELKARSGDEAIDFMPFDDFHVGMVPDIQQYADAIVDGTQDKLARKMWTAIDFMQKKEEEEGDYGQASD